MTRTVILLTLTIFTASAVFESAEAGLIFNRKSDRNASSPERRGLLNIRKRLAVQRENSSAVTVSRDRGAEPSVLTSGNQRNRSGAPFSDSLDAQRSQSADAVQGSEMKSSERKRFLGRLFQRTEEESSPRPRAETVSPERDPSDPRDWRFVNKQGEPTVHHGVLERSSKSSNRLVIDISSQRAYLMTAGGSVAIDSPISTARAGKTTPKGTFSMGERVRTGKVSTIYGVAMPYWMRLGSSLYGVHAGYLPGYPASAGCIRLPEDAARLIYDYTQAGTKVTIRY